MSNEQPKKTSASLEYSAAVAANPTAFSTPRTPKTVMTELEKARHEAFLNGHPLAKE